MSDVGGVRELERPLLSLGCAALIALLPAAGRAEGGEEPRPADLTVPAPAPSPAETPAAEPGPRLTLASAAIFAAGVVTAFAVHETCHVAANYLYGNQPRLEPVKFLGFIPFFAITPGIGCGPSGCYKRDGSVFKGGVPGYYTIVSAGILAQQATDEAILIAEPRLRYADAPFLKGMLAFNTLTSIAYAIANWTSIEPPEGDLRTMTQLAPYPRGVLALLVFLAAGLDIARYFLPDVPVLPWVSRAAKLATTGLVFAF